jgi:hypothetical protein
MRDENARKSTQRVNVSLKHKDHAEYNRDVGPRPGAFIQQQRDRAFEDVLGEAFMLFSWVMEDFKQKAKQHTDLFDKVGIILIEMQDALRGLQVAHASLSPATLAALTRIIMELRWNLRLILKSKNPALYADRFVRFGEIEKLIQDEKKPDDAKLLSPAQRERITKLCPEWIKTKKNGSTRYDTNWTCDNEFDSVGKIAKATGCEDEYDVMYAVTSKYMHGSPLLLNTYAWPDGHIKPIGHPERCKSLAAMCAKWALDTLMDAATFFGVPFEKFTQALWWARLVEAIPEFTQA